MTANSNFKILDDGSMEAKNGKFIGTVTGSTIQTSEIGKRAVLDTSSALKGYEGDTLYNLLDMASEGAEIQMTIDAKNMLAIRAPKLGVINKSYGTESGTVNVATTGNLSYVYDVDKDRDGCKELWVEDTVYCTLPVYLKVYYRNIPFTLGMWTGSGTTFSERV